MSALLKTDTREIGGHTFTIRVLDFASGMGVYTKLQKLLVIWGDADALDIGPFCAAGMAGLLTADDLQYYTTAFGKNTTVDFGDGRVMTLTKTDALNEAFAGSFSDCLEWLDACVSLNFGGVIEKMKGAVENARVRAEAAPKAAPTD